MILFLSLFLASCTVYTEKQSEALSRNAYATDDSLNEARVDLAYYYSQETVRLIKPPKSRIDIKAVYQNNSSTVGGTNTTRIAMIPEQYKSDKVVTVNTGEYQNLIQDKAIATQLKKDNQNITLAKAATEKELAKQAEMTNKMVNDLNTLQKKILEKNLRILQLSIVIAVLLGIIGGYIYLRISKLLPF
jgi:hypothetical protein